MLNKPSSFLIIARTIDTCSGYMSPEYAYCGHVSTKSDMFSFGVIILEMVTARSNNSTYECVDSEPLLSYVGSPILTLLFLFIF